MSAAAPWRSLVAAAGIALAVAATARAEGAAPDPAATPQSVASVRDPEFGVVARHYGLERNVEMYQWRLDGNGGYSLAWSAQPFDSSGFAPGHENPPFPLRSRRWLAEGVSVDGVPLDAEVIAALGHWVSFRPGFNALPGNLAATFQPQGDGLGTAENPAAPQVGDLRIRWRELRLPPLQDRIALRDGRWRLKRPVPRAAGAAEDADAPPPRRGPGPGVLVACALVVAVVAGAVPWMRRRARGRRR